MILENHTCTKGQYGRCIHDNSLQDNDTEDVVMSVILDDIWYMVDDH